MPNIFAIIGQSWDFARKQPTVLQSAFWFLFLPSLAGNLVADYQLSHREYVQARPEMLLLMILSQLLFALILLWGTTAILCIGKRLLQAKSGRTRTSFKTVSAQTKVIFIPLLLTSILRSIFTVLWGLLLVVPGIIYFFRTVFFPVIVVCEGVAYRPALKECLKLSRGKFWSITGSIIVLSLLTLFPAQLVATLFGYMAGDIGMGALVSADVASSLLFALALTLYLLGLIGCYDYYKPKGHVRN